MQIAHEEARRLIQFNVDDVLSSEKLASLSAHLKDCSACQAYASEIKQVDIILRPLLKRQWNAHLIPLSLGPLIANKISKRPTNLYLTMRTTLIAIVLAGFVFSAWQFMLSGIVISHPTPLGVLPAPTTSLQSTNTESLWENCTMVHYEVREGETLNSIARQFSVSVEEIIAFNNLKSETVTEMIELDIPVCHFTPRVTAAGSATFTMTYTPGISPTTSTPDG